MSTSTNTFLKGGSSTLLCLKQDVKINQLSFNFQFAYQCSNYGFVSFIITKKVDHLPDLHRRPFSECPERLNRIFFKHCSTKEEIINWCNYIQEEGVKPSVILINEFDDFSGSNKFEPVEVSAALIDASNFLSEINRLNTCHLIISVKEESRFNSPPLWSLFNNIFLIEKSSEDIIANLVFPVKENSTQFKLYKGKDNSLEKAAAYNFLKINYTQ
ncbi:uncharacterized protein LOC106663346 [Cimex lectularius]|uniref:Uncharacterized protein n=1 Tax=Cimex lectularius TaxID=79782 RepID=A0A8I6RCL7_CIMLE|nr:uncharacterized protein LOC106663346 [Cimex lectularius]